MSTNKKEEEAINKLTNECHSIFCSVLHHLSGEGINGWVKEESQDQKYDVCVGAAGLDYQKKYMMRTVTKIIQFFNIMSV